MQTKAAPRLAFGKGNFRATKFSFPQVRALKERKDSNHQVANVESHVHACSMLETASNSKNAGCPSKGITPEIRRIELETYITAILQTHRESIGFLLRKYGTLSLGRLTLETKQDVILAQIHPQESGMWLPMAGLLNVS